MIKKNYALFLLLIQSPLYSGKTRIKNLSGVGASFFINWPAVGCSNDIGYIEHEKTIDLGGHGSCEAKKICLSSQKLNKDESGKEYEYSYCAPIPNSGGSQNVDIYLFRKEFKPNDWQARINNPEGWMVELDNTDGSPIFFQRLAGVAEQMTDTSKQIVADIGRISKEVQVSDVTSVIKSVGTGGVSDIAQAGVAATAIISEKASPAEAPKEPENAKKPEESSIAETPIPASEIETIEKTAEITEPTTTEAQKK